MKNLPVFESTDFKTSSACPWEPRVHCVEVAYKEGIIAVRDSKNPQLPPLHFDKNEWAAFISGVKTSEFDY
ncbi:hypothetical protein BH10PSE19_BH10PSE19_20190 [soil metagenome]